MTNDFTRRVGDAFNGTPQSQSDRKNQTQLTLVLYPRFRPGVGLFISKEGGLDMEEPKQEADARPHQTTPEEWHLLSSQGISPITGKRRPSSIEMAKEKERESKHKLRVFLVFGVPVGLVLAFVISLSSNLDNTGFFCCWAVCTLVSGAVFSSIIPAKKNDE